MSSRAAARAVAATGLVALLPGSAIGPDSAGLHVRAQTPATPTASITGTIAGDPGASVTGVSVLLFPSTAPDRSGRDVALRLRRVAPVTGQDGQPAVDGAVLIFAADESQWNAPRRTRLTPLASSGRAVVTGLPPGDYVAIARPDLAPNRPATPALLRAMRPAAVPFTLAAGEQKAIQLRSQGR